MALPFDSSGAGLVDFNFPQEVSQKALTDLDEALKDGNGQLTVDALVRYSIAQSGISQEKMPDIVNKIESVIKKEKQPHIRALLYHLEALAYQGYRNRFARWGNRNNPVEETPQDISEWDRSQFDKKILQLIDKSLSEPDALNQVAVTSMPDIIKCNELGATYVPTLLQFLTMKALELVDGMEDMEPLRRMYKDKWIASAEGNAPAYIYALINSGKSITRDEYLKYQDSEYSALLLQRLCNYSSDDEDYKMLKAWVERYPDSRFAPEIINMITEIERHNAYVRYPAMLSTRDSVTLKVDLKNTTRAIINVYRVPDKLIEEYRLSTSQLTSVMQVPVTATGTIPFSKTDIQVTLPPLPHGAYIVCAGDLTGNAKDQVEIDLHNYDIMRVTDLTLFSVTRTDNKNHIGAVDIKTGKPQQGVTINYADRQGTTGTVGKTDAAGLTVPPEYYKSNYYNAQVPFDNLSIGAKRGSDKYASDIYYNRYYQREISHTQGEVYTDLGVYRPGETVHWAVVTMNQHTQGRKPLSGMTIEVIFTDHNRETIDTAVVTTDDYGRAEGSFVVPKDRMNGTFHIVVKTTDKPYSRQLAYKNVNVSEYKTPTFAVTFPEARRSYTIGQPVKVSGKAETYSGMPVANTTVRLSLIQHEWRWGWWYRSSDRGTHLIDTTVTTDEQGMFTFTYEPSLFNENKGYSPRRWAHYRYEVEATVTTDAGETQKESTEFIVGTRRGIELGAENGGVYYNDKPIKLSLTYNTTDEQHPTTWCTWEVTPLDGKEPVKTGNFNTGDPTVDLTDLPSGMYTIEVRILDAEEGEEDVSDAMTITLYRKTDKTCPVKNAPLWVPLNSLQVDKNNVGHVTVGVSVPKAYIYHVATASNGKVLSEGWLNYGPGLHDFTVALPREAGADVQVYFTTYYDNNNWSTSVNLSNPYKPEALKISATSFRDKLIPGDTERWTFSLTDQNGKPLQGTMLLAMCDKAIASIAPNDWRFYNWRPIYYGAMVNTSPVGGSKSTNATWVGKMLNRNGAEAILPYLYTYGNHIFAHIMREEASMLVRPMLRKSIEDRSAPVMANVAVTEEAVGAYDTEEAAGAMDTNAEKTEVNQQNLDKVVLRENDVKTALWQPALTTDARGNIQLEFEVPNFNTTWITQAVAWDKKMHGDNWMAEVLTQKPLMVRSNMPRFLRQGDNAQLAATVQNATDQAAQCDAVIELFDPRTDHVYATRKFNLQLESKGSQAVTIDWQVPDSIAYVGFRIKAANGRYGDGEQVMVPVLTTISPVIETEPFYIDAAQGHFETTLPQFPKDARVTLEYCDNPTWYCVLALPTIFSDNYFIATHAAHSLFALQVAQGVAKSQPQIKEAVTYWKQHNEDSVLVSMLQRNQDLKIGTLLASPWMRDAERQTLRMSKLNELFDEAIVKKEYEKIISSLKSLQMSDGGFTWFLHPDCKSSYWTTGSVLEILGDIKHLGYLPQDNNLEQMIKRAIEYYDTESVNLYKNLSKSTSNPYGQFDSYAYVRSMYPEYSLPKANATLMKKTVKHMDKNWNKGLTISRKAFYAMTLNRNGYKKTAQRIIESIRQFALIKPNLGMYWDNLQRNNGWWEFDKVAYTSTVLRAMSEVDPRQDELDQVRKWMLLMKQSNDWGSYSLAADAVYSILTTGSQWLDRATKPSITIAGTPLTLDKMAEWLGYFRTTLSASTSGNVVIDRTGNSPAWGAIYSQYSAPMTQIQEKAIEEISISKEYYVYAADGTLHQATSFKVGDKVKVRVIIKANRDMDYVTVTDERAACFEPVDQLSGYRSEDRAWFYLETKDTSTNMFFNNLNKGTHILGYDVWVTNPGEFTSGIATIQSQYAPQLTAHSAGKTITVDQTRAK